MRTAILSDIHGNRAALTAVLSDVDSQSIDRVVCLGDVVGYGPHPRECLDRVMEFEFCILGNHDNSALFDPEGFNRTAEQAIFWTRERLQADGDQERAIARMAYICGLPRMRVEDDVMFVHGSPRGPTNEYVFPEDTHNTKKMEKLFAIIPRFCFQGHTHVPGVFSNDLKFVSPAECDHHYLFSEAAQRLGHAMRLMINVGSVGQPRDGDPRSCYAILHDDGVEFRRVKYDVEATVSAVEAEPQLDNMLGYRLREGR